MSLQRNPAPPFILHCHIPKTAGTTVSIGFRKSFEFFHIHHYHPDPFFTLSREALENLVEMFPGLRSISSHHLRSFPLSVAGRPTFLLTFLRKPEDTFISELRYVQRKFWSLSEPIRRLWPQETPQLTLKELARRYLDQEAATDDLCPQTRFICNPDTASAFGISDGNPKGVNSYEMAYRILTGFHFVGVVEEMKKSLEILTDRLLQCGVRAYFDHGLKANTSPESSRPDWLNPDDEVGRRVLAASENDNLLYTHFRDQLLETHRELRKRHWLGFGPAVSDAKDALNSGWRAGAESLMRSVRLYRSKQADVAADAITTPLSTDLLEARAAVAVADRMHITNLAHR